MKSSIFTFLFFAFYFSLNAQSPCLQNLADFQFVGEFNGHNYFLSESELTPAEAQLNAFSYQGYLAVIDDEAENNFLEQNISEMAYIGLNDKANEGELVWGNGDDFNYENFDICNFCNGNSDEMDYVMMHSWNGGWSWSSKWSPRKFILEIPCDSELDISFTMNATPEFVQVGEEFLMTLEVTNHGPTTATGIWIQFYHFPAIDPPVTELDEVITHGQISDFYYNGKDWYISTLEVGETAQLTLTYQLDIGATEGFEAIAFLNDVDQNDFNDSNNSADSAIEISSDGCPNDIVGFTTIGEWENNKYYVSETVATNALVAQSISESYGGNLASINSPSENDFIFQGISEMTYIGMHDREGEGILKWYDGSVVDYTNFDFCSFCNENSNLYNNVLMHHWNGTWSWSNTSNPRKFVMEISCGNSANSNFSNSLVANLSNEVSKVELDKVFPNPAEDFIQISVNSGVAKTIQLHVLDIQGKIVKQKNIGISEGENFLEMDINQLPAGIYFLRIPALIGKEKGVRFVKIRD